MSQPTEHLPQRFEIPSDAPAGTVDPYQERMARAQRGYQADLDSAWGADAVRAETDEPAAEQEWQAPAAEDSPGPLRWLRRRRERTAVVDSPESGEVLAPASAPAAEGPDEVPAAAPDPGDADQDAPGIDAPSTRARRAAIDPE